MVYILPNSWYLNLCSMSNKYYSRRSARKLARKSRRSLIITIFLTILLSYVTLVWLLPFFINGIGFVKSTVNPSKKVVTQVNSDLSLAPPVLNIPFEATNTAQINIEGYATPHLKVKLYLDDHEEQVVEAGIDGDFTFQNLNLSLGTNNINAKTVDGEGNESLASKTIKIIYENEDPLLTLTEPEDNKIVQGGDKKVKVSGKTDPYAHVFINGNQIILDNDGNFSSDQPLNEGDNIFTIKAVSLASNKTELERKVIYTP